MVEEGAIATKILVIQSSALDPVGVLGNYWRRQGAQLVTWLPEQQVTPPTGQFAGLVILGGPMNAYEDEQFPHLKQTVELIHQFHVENKPIMGVCLGSQLIARAFGSPVYPHCVPELGFSPVEILDTKAQEPWLRDCPDSLHLMQWHFDTFDLPSEATLLMTNGVCKHQAYRIGANIYGFQFHLEVTPDIVLSWMAMKNAWIEANYPHLDQQLREQLEHYAEASAQFAEKVADHWLALMAAPMALTN